MKTVIHALTVSLSAVVVVLILVIAAFAIPWKTITWGTVTYGISPTITVTGSAKSQQQNQKASFSAGVNVVNDNKDTAVSQANDKINAIIAATKNFGIKPEDIKTENMSVYQNEESYYEDGRQKVRPGQWRVSNSVNVTLRDVTKAGQLTDVLSKAGATNIWGPNFTLDDTDEIENQLLAGAVADARNKADIIAKSNKRSLGKLVTVTEGVGVSAVPFTSMAKEGMGGGGGIADVQPGSATVTKTVTAVFELK